MSGSEWRSRLCYRSLAEHLRGPVDRHMAASTAWWLRKVLAGLETAT